MGQAVIEAVQASREQHTRQRVQRGQTPGGAGLVQLQPPRRPPEGDLRPEMLSSLPIPATAPARC